MKTYKSFYCNQIIILLCLIGFSTEMSAKFLNEYKDINKIGLTTFFSLNEYNAPMSPHLGDCSNLFISEYIEGSSNNKAIEIYNPTSESIDLSDYSIKKYSNGSGSSITTYSSWAGTIPAKGTVIVRNSSAALSGITSVAQFITSSSVFQFNGNDPVALFKNSDLIDIVGPIGSSSDFAKDKTLVRKSGISKGVTSYNSSEWDVNSQNFTDSLGGHYSSSCTVVLPPSCDTDTLFYYTACDSLLLGDSTYYASTILTDTLLNAENCDSVITTEIAINSSYNEIQPEVSGIDSVVVNGISYYSTQTLNLSLTTINGCDSMVEIPISILSSSDIDTIAFQSFEVNGDSWSYVINESIYNTNGDVWDSVQNLFSINPTEGDYFWAMRDLENGISTSNLHTMTFSTIDVSDYDVLLLTFDYYSNLVGGSDFVDYVIEFNNGLSWDSIISLNNNSDEWLTQEIIIPSGTQYVRLQLRGDFNGGSDYAAYDNVLLYGISSPSNCAPVDTSIVQKACGSYIYLDSTYTQTTQVINTLSQAHSSCDSIVTLDLTINNSVSSTDIQVACESYTWINGVTYTSSNTTAKDTLISVNGCDSIITLDLTINNSVLSTDIQVACESYTWINGVTYTSSNTTAKDTLTSVQGCDSIITLDLIIDNSVSSIDIQVACESYTWINGVTYTSSNTTAKDTLTSVYGCDSIITLNLTINNLVTSTDMQVACESYTWINGVTYTENNSSARDTIISLNGCDSVIILDLTIHHKTLITDTQIACDSFTWINGVTYMASNTTAKDTLTSVYGCDSIVALDLTINNSVSSTDTQLACESYTWINGVTYTASNTTAKDTLISENGCDSIISLNLTINYPVLTIDSQIACDSYTWINGVTYTTSNTTAKDTLNTSEGCDSIITLNLTISEGLPTLDYQIACDSFTWINGVTYTEDNNSATDTLTSENGCDSVIALILTINHSITSIDSKVVCDSLTWINGVTYTADNNSATDTLISSNGCDSIVTLNLTVNHSFSNIDTQISCESYTWINGITYTASNTTAKDTLTSVQGCDSIITLDLTINNSVSSTDIQIACESYTWINGVTYTTSNTTAKDTLNTVHGCDSIITLNLTINNTVFVTDTQLACGSYTWINGVTYTTSNHTAKDTLNTVSGCDSIITLNLTISDKLFSTDFQSACGSYTWINGVTYTDDNHTAKDTLESSGGCDSIISLSLTFLESTYGIDDVIAFGSYTWINGVTYTENNHTAKDTILNVKGCDSIIELNLTINQNYCPLYSSRVRYEWIENVKLGSDINNTTGKESGGYGFYTTDTLVVDTNSIVNVELTPGYKRRAYKEYWRIWVDWNYDGDFNDLGEKVFEQSGKNLRSGTFSVPVDVSPMDLRVRVALRWRRYAPSCGRFSNGEVEDYIMRVNGTQGANNLNLEVKVNTDDNYYEDLVEITELYPNPVVQGGYITGYIRVEEIGPKLVKITNTLGQVVTTEFINCIEEEQRFTIPIQTLESGIYFMQIGEGSEAVKMVVK